MDLRTAATPLVYGRMAFGSALLVAPSLVARVWIGDAARDPGAAPALRALAVRDLALGVEALLALRGGDAERRRRAFAAGALSDATDCLATLVAGRALPPLARLGTVAVAGGSAALGAALATAARGDAPAPSSNGW